MFFRRFPACMRSLFVVSLVTTAVVVLLETNHVFAVYKLFRFPSQGESAKIEEDSLQTVTDFASVYPSLVVRNNISSSSDNSTKISRDNSSVTVVTAYFDIGSFPKGNSGLQFTPDLYRKWIGRFRYIMNPVILYTDSKSISKYFRKIRRPLLKKTHIFEINRNTTWAFQRRDKIAEIFKNPSYPKIPPATVVPEYDCAQFAKYDVISRAAQEDIFKSKYYMWLDVGYFRHRNSHKPFYLRKPENFNDTKIAMNLVKFNRNMSLPPETILKNNLAWVGGGIVFGEKNVVIRYDKQFKKAVDYFISMGLAHTDQQVAYAMFSDKGRKALQPEIELQLYKSKKEQDWFYLGNKMIQEVT